MRRLSSSVTSNAQPPQPTSIRSGQSFTISLGGGAARVPYTELVVPGPFEAIIRQCTKRTPKARYQTIAQLRSDLYTALSSGPLTFSSSEEKEIVELLNNSSKLSESDWDRVFQLLDEMEFKAQPNDLVMRAIRSEHIVDIASIGAELLAALGEEYCQFVNRGEGRFDWDYCDVLGDRLTTMFASGDIALKANTLISLLILGASHNRWFVERQFMKLAGPDLPDAVANRVCIDVAANGIAFKDYMEHVEGSISTNRSLLHPNLQAMMA